MNNEVEQVLKEFEELEYVKIENNRVCLRLANESTNTIIEINKINKTHYAREFYSREYQFIDIQEYQLLHRLFEIWGWLYE